MSATPIGNLTVGGLSTALASINASLIAELNASISAQLAISLGIELQISDPFIIIEGALSFNLSGEALLSLEALTPAQLLASLNVSLSANLALQASLNAKLSLQIALLANLGVSGVFAYAIDSTAAGCGADIAAELAGGLPDSTGPLQPVKGLLLLTDSPTSFSALGATIRVA